MLSSKLSLQTIEKICITWSFGQQQQRTQKVLVVLLLLLMLIIIITTPKAVAG